MRIQRTVIDINNTERGYICYSASCLFILLTYIGLYIQGFFNPFKPFDINLLGYSPEAITFFFSIISVQLGYFYISGDVDRDFWKIALASLGLIMIMDLQVLFNLVRYINSLI